MQHSIVAVDSLLRIVAVTTGKQWWPGEVLKQEGASYLIHYKDYGSNWDEWVNLERIGHYTGTE